MVRFILDISQTSVQLCKDRGREGEEEGIRERPERPLAFKEALDKLDALSEPQGGG